ncbi:MAG: crossover junction endodeoxyribonuclease RuvC [Deltaproteobacteria bacterium]|nr:MAG: crossover junction endodeoxyribonuclease RuvC [Deltaproteobacteria bacterium]
MRRVLGVDPGSLRTGYGIVDVRGNSVTPVAWGVIRLDCEESFPDRLLRIHSELSALISRHRPTEASVEKVFLAKNASSALKLGQARGAAIVTCRALGLAVHEYSAKEIKAAATGYGAAPKEQVAGMIARLLGIRETLPPDATDALAMAFCRAVTRDLS